MDRKKYFFLGRFTSTRNQLTVESNILGKDGFICDDVGWWSRFNTDSDGVKKIGIGHRNIMEGTGTNNQVSPSHGSWIVSFIIVVDIRIIT